MENNHHIHASNNTRLRYAEAVDRHYWISHLQLGSDIHLILIVSGFHRPRLAETLVLSYCLRHSFYANIIVYILQKVNTLITNFYFV